MGWGPGYDEVGGIIFGKQEKPRKPLEIPTISTTGAILPLPKFEVRIADTVRF